MERCPWTSRLRLWFTAVVVVAFVTLASGSRTFADEGGVPFWLSGSYASFAAVPQDLGWYLPTMFYYYSGSASGSKSFTRGAVITAGLDTKSPLLFLSPTFVPNATFLGGRPSFSLTFGGGRNETSASATLSALGATIATNRSDSVSGMTDLNPAVSVAWSKDFHNWMVYVSGNIPTGTYDSTHLANIGIGHGAVDAGGGYTYLNTKTGLELSAVAGFTYNMRNPSTDYRNGVDSHLDYAISQFLSEQFHVGVVGYLYDQLTADSGSGAKLGSFESKEAAVGAETGYFFRVAGNQWYANLRYYHEYWAERRVQGNDVYAVVNIPLSSGKK